MRYLVMLAAWVIVAVALNDQLMSLAELGKEFVINSR